MAVTIYIRERRRRTARGSRTGSTSPIIGAAMIGAGDRLPLVQRLPGRGVHGRHGRDGARRRDRRDGDLPAGRRCCSCSSAAIFVIEALSVMIQVVSFRWWGRRVFLMAPLHHHFEMKAWSETKIMVRFWIVAGILCAAGFALFYKYYPQIRPPMKALVYGLARSGPGGRRRGSTSAGDEVVPVDRSLGNEDDLALLDGVELLVKSPGVPGERPLVEAARARGIPVWSELELGWQPARAGAARASSGSPGRTASRRRASCSARSSAPPAGTSRSPGTSARRSASVAAADWVGLRGLVASSSRTSHAFACEVAVAAQPRAGPPRPARDASRPTAPRSCGSSSGRGSRRRPARARARRDRVRGRRPAARRAADPRRATTARTPPRRPPPRAPPASGTRRSRRRSRTLPRRPPPARAGRRGRQASATSTTRRRRTSRRRCAALAAYADEPVHLILGGSPKGESFAPLAAGDRAERPLDPPRRRGRRRARRAPRRARARRRRDARRGPSRTPPPWRGPATVVLLSPACASYDQYDELRAARRRLPPARRRDSERLGDPGAKGSARARRPS